MLQKRTNKTITTGPFNNTYKEDEVLPKVEEGIDLGGYRWPPTFSSWLTTTF
jgi:hypothetical protein